MSYVILYCEIDVRRNGINAKVHTLFVPMEGADKLCIVMLCALVYIYNKMYHVLLCDIDILESSLISQRLEDLISWG